jgi:hypothetical protein
VSRGNEPHNNGLVNLQKVRSKFETGTQSKRLIYRMLILQTNVRREGRDAKCSSDLAFEGTNQVQAVHVVSCVEEVLDS